MLAMFNDTKLPTDNERALELLTSINTLWDENSWLDEETHETLHLEVSPRIQEEIVKVVVAYPESVEEGTGIVVEKDGFAICRYTCTRN